MARKARTQQADGDDENENEGAAAGRGIWTGSISFGLLQIPVKLFTAESRSEDIHFRQLDKNDLAPIKYERVSSATGKPVAWKDIVKGYEYEPDTFVVIDPAELKEAATKATQTLDIQDFVPADEIDPAFFETPYYLVPDKRSAKAYVLLREALKKKNAVAVATFVLRTKEHLAALLPVGNALMLEVLRYGHELRAPKDVPLPRKDAPIGARELAMAEQLIDGMMTAWDPSKYKDRYHGVVLEMIAEKAKTGAIKSVDPKPEAKAEVVDLLDLLRQSVKRTGGEVANDAKRPQVKRRPAAGAAGKAAAKKPRRAAKKKAA